MDINNYKILIDELEKAGKLRNNWYLVASITEKIKFDSVGPRQPAKRLKDASAACGYSTNTLNRMLAVKEFFDLNNGGISQLQGIDANALSFPSLEIVKRIHKVNSAEGIRMLTAVAAGEINFRELRQFYNKVVSENSSDASAHQVARLEARGFEEAALKAVNLASKELFVTFPNLTIEKPRDGRLPVGALAYRGGPVPVSGFEFVLLRDPENPKLTLENMLYRILFYSSFFNSYWVVFASNTGTERIRTFANIFEKLERTSIGVAVLPWGVEASGSGLELQILRIPTGTPNPDHRSALDNIEDLRLSLIKPLTAAAFA